MTEAVYRTGQAAKEWGVSSYEVRRLCEGGLIDAEFSAGKQWRIPASEVARIKREGVPAIPLLDTERRTPGPPKTNTDHGLLAPPSDDVVAAAEDVVILENEVKALGLRRQKEEGLDWFRDREDRENERMAAQEAAERERQEREETANRRREWADRWLASGLESLPYDAPRDVRLEVVEQMRRVLDSGDPSQPDTLTERLVEAAVSRALGPWKRSKERQQTVEDACDNLPWAMRHDSEWKHRATRAAGDAIGHLRDGATAAEMEAAAALALKPLVAEFEHRKRCTELADSAWRLLPGATYDEREQGKEAITEALAELPVGASQRQMGTACEQALESVRAGIAERHDREMREAVIRDAGWSLALAGLSGEDQEAALNAVRAAVDALPEGAPRSDVEQARERVVERYKGAQDRKNQKARLIDAGLREIYRYVQKLEQDWEFDKSAWALDEELKPVIREQLAEELSGSEPEEQVRNRVRRLVREKLGL